MVLFISIGGGSRRYVLGRGESVVLGMVHVIVADAKMISTPTFWYGSILIASTTQRGHHLVKQIPPRVSALPRARGSAKHGGTPPSATA